MLAPGQVLIFPQWKIACDLHGGDVLLFDGSDWHANGPFFPDGSYERNTVVAYFRWKMIDAGTAEEELRKAQRLTR